MRHSALGVVGEGSGVRWRGVAVRPCVVRPRHRRVVRLLDERRVTLRGQGDRRGARSKEFDALLATRLSMLKSWSGLRLLLFAMPSARSPRCRLWSWSCTSGAWTGVWSCLPGLACLHGVRADGRVDLRIDRVEDRWTGDGRHFLADAGLAQRAPFIVMMRPLLWPSGPRWLVPATIWLLDSSPFGVALNVGTGLVPRPGGLAEAVVRMAFLETIGGAVAGRLGDRQAAPGLARSTMLTGERHGSRRFARRSAGRSHAPPAATTRCFGTRRRFAASTRIGRFASQVGGLAAIGLLAWGTSWFAVPAFAELAERGYGALRETFTFPDQNPFTRVLVSKIFVSSSSEPAPGQARLEFNTALRQFSTFLGVLLIVSTFANGVESIERERRQDTWAGLIATPLTGWEILRGKMCGAVWNTREVSLILIGSLDRRARRGAVHPLGFVASLIWLGATVTLYSALGVAMGRCHQAPNALGLGPFVPIQFLLGIGMVILAVAGPLGLLAHHYSRTKMCMPRLTPACFPGLAQCRSIRASAPEPP